MFGRKKKGSEQGDAPQTQDADGTTTADETSDGTAVTAGESGPFDQSQVGEADGRVDFGGLWLRPGPGMELRLEVDPTSDAVSAVQVGVDDATVQLQAFAAPRSSGIWDEIRGEIAEMVEKNRGTVEEGTGPFGTELRTRLPQPGGDGRTVFAPAIFAGVDGPRWFLRAVYSGRAAVDEAARARLDDVVRDLVVVRGADPMAPREMLELKMPATEQS